VSSIIYHSQKNLQLSKNVCGVSDMIFLEYSSNRNWDTAEKIQLSAGKVPLAIKSAKS